MYVRRTLSILASALAIGVCAYITYISRDVEASSLAINFGFLGVMILAILISIFGLARLISVSRGLARAVDIVRTSASEDELFLEKNLFRNKFLNNSFSQYCDMVRRHPDGSCDIVDYINEDAIDTYVHMTLLDMVSDFLTSLGILGTFIGLVIGLRGFDPSGYEQMTDSIAPLIDGIKVAFVTSIYGIALSLPFSLNLHSEISGMEHRLEEFIDAYYLYVRPSHEVDSAAKMLAQRKDQEELANQLTQIFVDQLSQTYEQTITPAFTQMTDAVHQIVNTFTAQQEDAVAQICATIVNDIHDDLDDSFQLLADSVQQLDQAQANYMDFMDRSIKQLDESFASLQNHIEQADRYNEETMTTLSKAQQDAFSITDDQKETYQEYTRFIYDSIQQFTDVWNLNSEKLQGYVDEIIKLGPVQSNVEIRRDISALADQVRELQQSQATADDLSISRDETTQLLDDINKRLGSLERTGSGPSLFRRSKSKNKNKE